MSLCKALKLWLKEKLNKKKSIKEKEKKEKEI